MKLFKKMFIKDKRKKIEAFWKFFYTYVRDLVSKTELHGGEQIPAPKQPQYQLKNFNPPPEKPQPKASIPEEFNLHSKGLVSPPKIQGFCNVCAVFSVIGAIEVQAEIMFRKPPGQSWHRFSEQFLLFNSMQQPRELADCEPEITERLVNGWWITEALNFCKTEGFVYEADLPYNPYNRMNIWAAINKTPVIAGKIKGWDTYSRRVDGDRTLKKHLAEDRGALIFSFQIRPDFYVHREGIYRFLPACTLPPDSSYANYGHTALCIGYSDKRRAWYCKNSWGENWGEHGFFWLDYAFPFLADKTYYLYF